MVSIIEINIANALVGTVHKYFGRGLENFNFGISKLFWPPPFHYT